MRVDDSPTFFVPPNQMLTGVNHRKENGILGIPSSEQEISLATQASLLSHLQRMSPVYVLSARLSFPCL